MVAPEAIVIEGIVPDDEKYSPWALLDKVLFKTKVDPADELKKDIAVLVAVIDPVDELVIADRESILIVSFPLIEPLFVIAAPELKLVKFKAELLPAVIVPLLVKFGTFTPVTFTAGVPPLLIVTPLLIIKSPASAFTVLVWFDVIVWAYKTE